MTGLGGNAAEALKRYVERLERVQEEIDGLNGDKRELYAEIKAAGFDVKVFRKMMQRRAKDPGERDEEDSLLELYESAIRNYKKEDF